jgi:hypothetical protein
MYIAESADDIYSIVQRPQVGRGINVYSFAELFGVLARKKDGGKERQPFINYRYSASASTSASRYSSGARQFLGLSPPG